MVKYVCNKCGKEFLKKSNYMDHINKKIPCDSNGDLIVSTKIDLLIQKIEELQKGNEVLRENMKRSNEKLKRDNEKLKKELQEENKNLIEEIKMLKELNKVKNNGDNVYGNNNNNEISINNSNNKNMITFNINQFGTENDDFITDTQVRKILGRGFNSIPEYIKTIHFNESKPENHNIYLPNWRDKNKVLVYDGMLWNLEDKDDTITTLKDKGIDFIQKKYADLDKNIKGDALIIKKIDRFLESYNDNEEDKIDTLNDDILLVLYNNRNVVEKTRRSKALSNTKKNFTN